LKLDKLIKDSKLVERLNRLDPDNASGSKNDGVNYWKGKKIVSLAEWKRKLVRGGKPFRKGTEEDQRLKEALQFFPDDYEEPLFAFAIPQELKIVANRWITQFRELMYFRKNMKCSRLLCFTCLLCPDKEKGGKFVGISRIIAKAIAVDKAEGEEKEDDNSNSSNTTATTTTPSLYPCPVLNRFKCPYDRKEMKDKPKSQQPLVRNEEEVRAEEDSNSYDIDLDYLFLLSSYSSLVESAFINAKKEGSMVPIKNVEDIYNALTDRETLDRLLQQDLGEEYLEYKDEIVEFFMHIKESVRMEDLTFYKPTDA
jgi:hypothetical protein